MTINTDTYIGSYHVCWRNPNVSWKRQNCQSLGILFSRAARLPVIHPKHAWGSHPLRDLWDRCQVHGRPISPCGCRRKHCLNDGYDTWEVPGRCYSNMCVTIPLNCAYDHLMVGTFIVQHVPDWFPGTRFKALTKEAREMFKICTEGPMEYVRNAMKVCLSIELGIEPFSRSECVRQSGEKISQCIVSDCLSRLEDHEKTDFDDDVIRDFSATMFAGMPILCASTGSHVSDGRPHQPGPRRYA